MKRIRNLGYAWWLALSLGFIGLGCLAYGFWAEQSIFPSASQFRADGDHVDGGTSIMSAQTEGEGIRASWKYGTGFDYPYVTLSWNLEEAPGNCRDLHFVREIVFVFDQTQRPSFTFFLSELLPGWSRVGQSTSLRPRGVRIWPDFVDKEKDVLSISKLSVPDWWYVDHPDSPHLEETAMTHVCRMGFTFDGKLGEQGQINLYALKIRGDQRFVAIGSVLVMVSGFLVLILGIREYRQSRRQIRQLQARLELQEKMKPLPKPEKDWPKIQSKLEELWNNPELQMQTLVDQTGIPAHRITASIKESTGLNFKVLLNQMRLQKAEKMLLETDEQVAQIALQCGYGQVAHFYRVFKQKYAQSPGDWRLQHKSADKT